MRRTFLAACAIGLAASLNAQPAFREGYVVTPDNVRLHYEVHGSGPDTVVVVHGGPGLSAAYLAPDLGDIAEGFTAIYYDQRGGGRSTVVRDSTRLSLAHHVDDLEVMRRHFNLGRMTLMGHSWGAAPAAFYALGRPARVERLVLHDPMPPRAIYMQGFGQNLRAWMDSTTIQRVGELNARRSEPSADPVETCRAFWAVFIRGYMADPNGPLTLRGDVCGAPPEAIRNGGLVYAAALGPFDWDWRNEFSNLSAPVLVIHGAQSPIPAESAEEWTASLPHASLFRIEGAGHFAHHEQRAAFVRAIREFTR